MSLRKGQAVNQSQSFRYFLIVTYLWAAMVTPSVAQQAPANEPNQPYSLTEAIKNLNSENARSVLQNGTRNLSGTVSNPFTLALALTDNKTPSVKMVVSLLNAIEAALDLLTKDDAALREDKARGLIVTLEVAALKSVQIPLDKPDRLSFREAVSEKAKSLLDRIGSATEGLNPEELRPDFLLGKLDAKIQQNQEKIQQAVRDLIESDAAFNAKSLSKVLADNGVKPNETDQILGVVSAIVLPSIQDGLLPEGTDKENLRMARKYVEAAQVCVGLLMAGQAAGVIATSGAKAAALLFLADVLKGTSFAIDLLAGTNSAGSGDTGGDGGKGGNAPTDNPEGEGEGGNESNAGQEEGDPQNNDGAKGDGKEISAEGQELINQANYAVEGLQDGQLKGDVRQAVKKLQEAKSNEVAGSTQKLKELLNEPAAKEAARRMAVNGDSNQNAAISTLFEKLGVTIEPLSDDGLQTTAERNEQSKGNSSGRDGRLESDAARKQQADSK